MSFSSDEIISSLIKIIGLRKLKARTRQNLRHPNSFQFFFLINVSVFNLIKQRIFFFFKELKCDQLDFEMTNFSSAIILIRVFTFHSSPLVSVVVLFFI